MNKVYDVTIRDASEQLGCSISTVRRLIKRGQLSKRYEKGKRGNIIRLSSAEVDQLKDGRRDNVSKRAVKRGNQMVSLEVYNSLQKRLDGLLQKYEVVVYKLGASESRNRELEARSSWWDRFKGWLANPRLKS